MSETDDAFETTIPDAFLDCLLSLGHELGFDPTSSLEMEAYCRRLVEASQSERGDFVDWARHRLAHDFRSLLALPQWIQNPAWPVCNGRPMIFVGQVDVPPIDGLLHDEASFYVFWDPESGKRQTIVQVA